MGSTGSASSDYKKRRRSGVSLVIFTAFRVCTSHPPTTSTVDDTRQDSYVMTSRSNDRTNAGTSSSTLALWPFTSFFWQSVTGSKDQLTEVPLDVCRREVLEETGIDTAQHTLTDWGYTNRYEIFETWRHRYGDGVTHNTEYVFGLCVAAGTLVKIAPREHLQYRWLPWTAAAKECFSPSNAQAINQLPRR